MNVFTFAQARAHFEIAEGFDDDNEIHTDGALSDLPRMKFRRHGPLALVVKGCRFHVHSSATGNVSFFAGQHNAVVKIGPNTRLNTDIRLWRSARVVIGAHTTINQARLVSDNSDIHIGNDCMFSDDILIQSADQHGLIDLDSMEFSNAHRRKIVIGDHVWVGRRSVVMPDVEVGHGSVIGTGSIVTKSAGDCCYLVGVPARAVRERASWTRLPGRANPREEAFFERMKAPDGPLATPPEVGDPT